MPPEARGRGLQASEHRLELRTPGGAAVGLSLDQLRTALEQARRAIGIYDEVETDPHAVAPLDLTVPTLLGAPVDFQAIVQALGIGGLRKRLTQVSAILLELPTAVDLWEWPNAADNVDRVTRLYAACALPTFGPSQITKLLHRKRPRLLPIVDETCIWPAWSDVDPAGWTVDELARITFGIRATLSRQPGALQDLRRLADELGPPTDRLSTLRLYDLLAWTRIEGTQG